MPRPRALSPTTSLLRSAALALAVLAGPACNGGSGTVGPPEPLPEGAAGSRCFPAFDFNQPASASVTLDGWSSEWPFGAEFAAVSMEAVTVETKVAHYRITPPVPPTESDLYVSFEGAGADVNSNVYVTVALNPTGTDTDSKALLIRPFPGVPPNGAASGLTSADVEGYEWDGASWASWSPPVGAVEVLAAHDVPQAEWGAEIRVHLPDVGVSGTDFYMATYWQTNEQALNNLVTEGTPAEAFDPFSADPLLPEGDPGSWIRYTFGEDCAPDIYIGESFWACDDIYINEEGPDQSRIGINNLNEFHVRVHGDVDADAGTAEDVLVYLDLGRFGVAAETYAVNYPHTDANINFNGAGESLDTAVPEPPTPFDLPAQGVNDDVRVEWRPADEPSSPWADGDHVCVEGYAYYRDDPYLGNNFGQCNMQFVDTVAGRPLSLTFGSGILWPYDRAFDRLVLVASVVNTGSSVQDWTVRIQGDGIERTNTGWEVTGLGERGPDGGPGKLIDAQIVIQPPSDAFRPPRDHVFEGPGGHLFRRAREVYEDSPILVLRAYVPTRIRLPKGEGDQETVEALIPTGAYAGFAFRR